jgi:ATP-dependent DNA helicase RecQ
MPYNPQRALELLRSGIGNPRAAFREDQEEAISHIVEGRGRLLLVQKTGWGKSSVYFIATKLLREQGMGPALLVSPLLALMRNQIYQAERMESAQRRYISVTPTNGRKLRRPFLMTM